MSGPEALRTRLWRDDKVHVLLLCSVFRVFFADAVFLGLMALVNAGLHRTEDATGTQPGDWHLAKDLLVVATLATLGAMVVYGLANAARTIWRYWRNDA